MKHVWEHFFKFKEMRRAAIIGYTIVVFTSPLIHLFLQFVRRCFLVFFYVSLYYSNTLQIFSKVQHALSPLSSCICVFHYPLHHHRDYSRIKDRGCRCIASDSGQEVNTTFCSRERSNNIPCNDCQSF